MLKCVATYIVYVICEENAEQNIVARCMLCNTERSEF